MILRRTGRLLHGLGNVKFSQGFMEESEEYHRRALMQYQSTIGNNHHRTADVCHRVAQHCLRHRELEAAVWVPLTLPLNIKFLIVLNSSKLIDQALKVWSTNKQVYIPELARTTFLKARVLFQQKEDKSASVLFKEAVKLRNSIQNIKTKPDRELEEKDFDELVTFWSR